jgi:hypothetical protein
MAILQHQVWWEPDGQGNCRPSVCFAGPDGDDFRKRLVPGSLCVQIFDADSPAEAMVHGHFYVGGPRPHIKPQDREPYPQEWADRQHGNMTDAEVRAYGEIARAIANQAHGMASDSEYRECFPDVTGPIYYHYSSSAFEETAWNLWRLKIFRPIGKIEYDWAFYFVFDCDLKDASSVAIQHWRSEPLLSSMIVNLINLFGDYGTDYWGFSTKPDTAFGANGRLESTLEALAAIGYLDKVPHGFVWTTLAATAMQITGYWPLPDWQLLEPNNEV